jgi:hypothetical protein
MLTAVHKAMLVPALLAEPWRYQLRSRQWCPVRHARPVCRGQTLSSYGDIAAALAVGGTLFFAPCLPNSGAAALIWAGL